MVRAQWCLLGTFLCVLCLQIPKSLGQECAAGNSLFQKQYNYPYPWWVVYPADVAGVANRALTLRSALVTSEEAFAEQVILGIARNQTQAIAKSIGESLAPGYMVNANATLGGGCPVPPPPSAFLQRIGRGFAASVEYSQNTSNLFGGQTEAELQVPAGGMSLVNSSIVSDTILAAMFVAGRSCGPPDALSSSSLAAIRTKYINATCYYAGPIFRAVTNNNTVPDYDVPCYNSTFEADIVLSNITDQYVAGPLLSAFKECIVGPPEVMNVPSWLYYSFGPVVSIDSANSGGQTSTSTDSTSAGSSSSGGSSGGSLDTLDDSSSDGTSTSGR